MPTPHDKRRRWCRRAGSNATVRAARQVLNVGKVNAKMRLGTEMTTLMASNITQVSFEQFRPSEFCSNPF